MSVILLSWISVTAVYTDMTMAHENPPVGNVEGMSIEVMIRNGQTERNSRHIVLQWLTYKKRRAYMHMACVSPRILERVERPWHLSQS